MEGPLVFESDGLFFFQIHTFANSFKNDIAFLRSCILTLFRRIHLCFIRTLAQKITLETMRFNFLIFRKEKLRLAGGGGGGGGVSSASTEMT